MNLRAPHEAAAVARYVCWRAVLTLAACASEEARESRSQKVSRSRSLMHQGMQPGTRNRAQQVRAPLVMGKES